MLCNEYATAIIKIYIFYAFEGGGGGLTIWSTVGSSTRRRSVVDLKLLCKA